MAYTLIFLLEKCTHFFSKNTCGLDIVLTRTVNILTTNASWLSLQCFEQLGPDHFLSALYVNVWFED